MKELTIFEETPFTWRACSLCGKRFKSQHIYEEAFGLKLASEDCVCLPCRIMNPKGDIFKAKTEEDKHRASLEFEGFIQDSEDIFSVYKCH